jgi:uncharacterized protein
MSVHPFREFVLKVHELCNLACTYCYMYELADQSYLHRPPFVSDEVIAKTAMRIGRHVRQHALDSIHLVLHGGEPLMAGPELPVKYIRQVREAVGPQCSVHVTMQTNGTLLTEKTIQTLTSEEIGIGVSLDGGSEVLNRQRVNHAGKSTWSKTAKGLELLMQHPEVYSGILCVIDVKSDPVEVYESLLRFNPPSMHFLLPLGNHTSPPPGLPSDSTPYGDWLGKLFDRWFDKNKTEQNPKIRYFLEIINLLLGQPGSTEMLGLSPYTGVVVETDGTIQQVDALKSAFEGAPETGLNVIQHEFDKALEHPGVIARQIGLQALAPKCKVCFVKSVCGGGYYPHRYRESNGFRNPSIYCRDLQQIIAHISNRFGDEVAKIPS